MLAPDSLQDGRLETGEASLRFSAITSLEAFDAVESAWSSLFANAAERCPALSHGWLRAWWNAFGADKQLYILLAWRADELVGAAPLCYRAARIYARERRVLSVMANTWVDRFQFLLAPPAEPVMKGLLQHLFTEAPPWDFVELFPVPDDSPQTALLAGALEEMGACYGRMESLVSPCLVLPEGWDDLLERFSGSFRESLRRKLRKADRVENLSVQIVTDESCVDPIMDISLDSWQHEAGTSLASTPAIRRFYSEVIQDAAKRGELLVGLMYLGREPIAFELNILGGSTLHNLKLGYRRRHADLSPGIVLKARLLRHILESSAWSGIEEYDFMGTVEAYKLQWSTGVRTHSHYRVFSRSLEHGLLKLLFFHAKPWLRASMPGVFRAARAAVRRIGRTR